jgi:hypothetical protein
MSKTSFKKSNVQGEAVTPEENGGTEETAVAVREVSHVVPANLKRVVEVKSKGFTGEVTTDNLNTPYLSLVGKTGALSDEFDSGSFVYDKQHEVCGKGKSFNLTLINVDLSYVEDLAHDSEEIANKFKSLNDAISQGWHNEYDQKDDGRYVVPVVNAVVLIEVAEDISEFDFGGKFYALAAWTLKKTGYTHVGKKIINACRKGWLKDAVYLGSWQISSKYETSGSFSYWRPEAARGDKHSPEFIKFIEEDILGN